ncbi:MAG: DUF116 domain-containing protein [Thermoplasmatales archaeon]|nr:MAG: DUF116 domain-containing protein [Thermoplasmatales archaeon]
MNTWRLLDIGQLTAAENMALDEVILKAKNIAIIPNTVRFLQFLPPAVLLGYHQSLEQEIRVDFCKKAGIDINRRITGGGTIFFDETQIGWEIICEKDFFQRGIADTYFFERLSQPLISFLNELGINASFRPRNDIDVNGRKISGTGGTEEGNVFLFQGTLLVDFDVATMLKALRIPIAKLKDKEIDQAKDRVTCLKWELGYVPSLLELKSLLWKNFEKEFNVVLEPGGLTTEENTLFMEKKSKFESQRWINKITLPKDEQQVVCSILRADGGLIKTCLMINKRFNRIQSAFITGDFFAYPKRIIFDLEALLKETPADINIISKKIIDFFEKKKPQIPGVRSIDFINAIDRAIGKIQITHFGIPLSLVNRIFTVNAPFAEIVQNSPRHLLLPYCSKSLECGYRYKRECAVCGGCSISEAFKISQDRDMQVTTILNFEDLMNTLEKLRLEGVGSYVGCCCEAFYTKHIEDFERKKIPGILVDIDNTTCYELGKSKEAYDGKFESQTDINIDLLRMVLDAAL